MATIEGLAKAPVLPQRVTIIGADLDAVGRMGVIDYGVLRAAAPQVTIALVGWAPVGGGGLVADVVWMDAAQGAVT